MLRADRKVPYGSDPIVIYVYSLQLAIVNRRPAKFA